MVGLEGVKNNEGSYHRVGRAEGKSYHTQSRRSWEETILIGFKVERDLTLSHPWSEKHTP